ncbi:mitochondrial inner membrane magnesium transporter mrs2 isoform X3 [Cryptomeria japonica]|uniref:mitochondrial inner membrane magnesium transporter mrs2 isoform X3 n=1 Tax=Cryptomeria japonica TaxID=3369 RepID=UPI0025ACC642|nr:mitochondrial inner membrane magnesium transporter mrs2 isoform X3 [Cryptomeria japonica]
MFIAVLQFRLKLKNIKNMQSIRRRIAAIEIRETLFLRRLFTSSSDFQGSGEAFISRYNIQSCFKSSWKCSRKHPWLDHWGARSLKNHFGPISVDERTSNVSLAGGSKYSVIKIDDSGSCEPMLLTVSELGIHPRDMDLLIGNFFIPKRSTIATRNEKVLIRMENVRALVCRRHCFLFDAHHPRKGLQKSQLHSPKVCVSRQEALQKLQRLLPLKRVLTEVEHDISDTHEALEQVLESDDALMDLCLECLDSPTSSGTGSQHFTEQDQDRDKLRRAAADIMLTYQRQVDDAGGVVEELRKGIESAQEVWELTLDTTRNKIIRTNLFISMASLSLTSATVPAGFFGMNLVSGLESAPSVFYIIVGATSASSIFVGLGLLFVFRKFLDNRRAQDLAALQDLLSHIDDIDDIFQVLASKGAVVSQEDFKKFIRIHPSTKSMQEREIDLMFRMFDSNHNGQLEGREWNRGAQRTSKGKKHQCGT